MNINKHRFYMNIVDAIAKASHATRGKVGALLERDGNIIAFGYNGMPAGFDNECEQEEVTVGFRTHNEAINSLNTLYKGSEIKHSVTKPEVLHAESNAIAKCARSAVSSADCTLYCTYSPCMECAKLIVQAGIRRVIFKEKYRDTSGIILLETVGISVMIINFAIEYKA